MKCNKLAKYKFKINGSIRKFYVCEEHTDVIKKNRLIKLIEKEKKQNIECTRQVK